MSEYDELLGSLRRRQGEAREVEAELAEKRAEVRVYARVREGVTVCVRPCVGVLFLAGEGAELRHHPSLSGWHEDANCEPMCHAFVITSHLDKPPQVSTLSSELSRKERELAGVRSALAAESEALSARAAELTAKALALTETSAALEVGFVCVRACVRVMFWCV